jgi:4-hydroxy-4-methyl-2-oxoglutarate aldolase
VTISYFPSCSAALDPERYNLANLVYEAVGDDPAEKVLVLASNGYTDVSVGGGTKLFRLQEHRLAGVLTDGRLRDFDELAGYDFAGYCSGEATRWGGDHVTPFQANVPVVLDRVGVMPGQHVYADSSGAVVIPERQLEDVLAEARRIVVDDERFRADIDRDPASGHPGHFGLDSMHSRASEIGGALTISSAPGQGTVVRVEAPAQTAQAY